MPLRNAGIGYNRTPALGGPRKPNHPAAYRAPTPAPIVTQYGAHECKFNPAPMIEGITVENMVKGAAVTFVGSAGNPAAAVVGVPLGIVGGVLGGAYDAAKEQKECKKNNPSP